MRTYSDLPSVAAAMSNSRANAPDLTLALDIDGVIQTASLSSAVADEGLEGWVGRAWHETVTEVAGDKVRHMIEDARRSGVSGFRQITQRFPSGLELPFEYTTVRLGGKAGLIAVGKNLHAVGELQSRLIAAQHAREQDYWKLREIETRYRLLFDTSHEAVLILTIDTLRVVEANPAAIRVLGLGAGSEFPPEIAAQDREGFQATLQRARDQGRTPAIVLHLGPTRSTWMVRVSLMASGSASVYVLQIVPVGETEAGRSYPERIAVDRLVDRLPDGFVVIGEDGMIRQVNGAFLDQVQVGAEGAVIGQPLGRWFGKPGADVGLLIANVARHRAVSLFASRITGEFGPPIDVEVSAVANADDGASMYALVIRNVGRRMADGGPTQPLDALVDIMAKELGSAPLQQIVRDATAVVERRSIERAIARSGGNRTAAAVLLGLSRQSLYVKMARYKLDGASPPMGGNDA